MSAILQELPVPVVQAPMAGDAAPRAYPEVHHLTSPLRAHGRRRGDADLINLWAGQAHRLAEDRSAEEITRLLGIGAREALAAAADRFHD